MLKRIKNLLKASSFFLAVAVTIIITILSLIKVGAQPISFTYLDKVEHAIAYATLSFFWLLSLGQAKKSKIIIIVLCVFYGVLIEFLQSTTSYRTFDYADMLANAVGVMIGFLIFKVFTKSHILTQ